MATGSNRWLVWKGGWQFAVDLERWFLQKTKDTSASDDGGGGSTSSSSGW